MKLVIAAVINLLIIILEVMVLSKLKNKKDMFKYYTYFMNFVGLVSSLLFCVILIFNMKYLEFAKGIQYISTSGLLATMVIYTIFIGKNNKISDKDFKGVSGEIANIVLHYLCPFLSMLSLIICERDIVMNSGVWTAVVSLPSIIYWVMYLILSVTKLWNEPYDFSSKNGNKFVESLTILAMPVIFIGISIILWEII